MHIGIMVSNRTLKHPVYFETFLPYFLRLRLTTTQISISLKNTKIYQIFYQRIFLDSNLIMRARAVEKGERCKI